MFGTQHSDEGGDYQHVAKNGKDETVQNINQVYTQRTTHV
jgi:hypothetical protein